MAKYRIGEIVKDKIYNGKYKKTNIEKGKKTKAKLSICKISSAKKRGENMIYTNYRGVKISKVKY